MSFNNQDNNGELLFKKILSLFGHLCKKVLQVSCTFWIFLTATTPVAASVLYEAYRGTVRVPVLPAPRYINNGGSDAQLLQNLKNISANPANAVTTGIVGNIDFMESSLTLCDADADPAFNLTSACQQGLQGMVFYTLVKFPGAGSYSFSFAHDDQVDVDISTQLSTTDYRNANYNVPVGTLSSYTSGDTIFENLPGSFVSPATNSCYLMRVYWNNVGGNNLLRMRWAGPGTAGTEIVPASNLLDPGVQANWSGCSNAPSSVTLWKNSVGGTGTFSFTGDNGYQGDSITTVSTNVPVSGRSLSLAQSSVATTLTESAPPAGWALSDIACTGLGSGGTATPNIAGRSVLLDALATAGQNNISCTFTNVKLPRLQVQKQLPGGRFGAADQFTLTVNGPAATSNSVTTTGSARVANGIATLNSGVGTYSVAETASGGTNLSNYTSSYSCVNATSGGTVVPSGTGSSFSTPLAANDDVLCSVTNTTFPVLSLSKTTGITPMQVGVAQDYVVTVQNTGGGASPASVQVLDRLPAHVQFNSAGGASCVPSGSAASGQLLTCTVAGSIAAAESATFTVNVTPLLATAGTSVTNRASVDPQGGTPGSPAACVATNNPAGCATVTTLVAAVPSLSLAKSSPAVFVVGTPANYTLTVSNSGGAASPASVAVQEHLPANLQFNSVAGASCVASGAVGTGQGLACTVPGPIPVGASVAFSINVTPLAAVASTTVTNRAQVDPQGGVPGNSDLCTATGIPAGCATVNTPVDGVPRLGLSKASPSSFVVGVPSPYTLTVSNTGSAASPSSFYVFDTLPANVQFNSASGASCTASGSVASGLNLSCQVAGAVAVGGSLGFTVNVTALPATAGTLLTNRASVDPGGNFPPIDPSTCTATGTPAGCATVTTPVNAIPVLALTKTGPASFAVGTAANYTLGISNSGGAASPAGVVVQDLLPANVQFNSASGASCTVGGSLASGQLLSCTLAAPVAASGSASFSINVTALAATASTTVTNRATVDAQGGTPGNPASCSATGIPAGCATANTPVNGLPILDLLKTGPAQWVVGTPGNYTLTVRNTGSAASPASFYVRDRLPANLQFNSAAGAVCTATGTLATGVDLLCLLSGPVAMGGSVSFIVNVTALSSTAGTVLTNRAAVDTGGNFPPPDPSTCTSTGVPVGCATVTTPVDTIAVLSLAKTSPASFTVGAAADYTLTISNSGGAASPAGVPVWDQLPANVQFNSASGASCAASGSLASGQLLICTLAGSLAAGGSTSFTVNVTAQIATANTVVTNRATVGVQGGGTP